MSLSQLRQVFGHAPPQRGIRQWATRRRLVLAQMGDLSCGRNGCGDRRMREANFSSTCAQLFAPISDAQPGSGSPWNLSISAPRR
jgi:hypothetical protein